MKEGKKGNGYLTAVHSQVLQDVHVGIMTRWNYPCGIVEHTKFFVQNLSSNFKILADTKYTEGAGNDEDYVIRCWSINLIDYPHTVDTICKNGINVLHIQHDSGLIDDVRNFQLFLQDLKNLKVKVILDVHATGQGDTFTDIPFMREIHPLVNRIVVHTKKAENLYHSRGLNKTEYIPLASVPFPQYDKQELLKKYNIKSGHIISTFGLIASNKCMHDPMYAIQNLKPEYPDIKYIICGQNRDPSYFELLQNKVKELDIEDNVVFFEGWQPLETVIEILELSNILTFLYNSKSTSMSAAVTLALNAQRPIITSTCDMFDDFSEGVIKVKIGDVGGLTKQIRTLLENPELQNNLIMKSKKIKEQMRGDVIAGRFEKMYKRLIEEDFYNA